MEKVFLFCRFLLFGIDFSFHSFKFHLQESRNSFCAAMWTDLPWQKIAFLSQVRYFDKEDRK